MLQILMIIELCLGEGLWVKHAWLEAITKHSIETIGTGCSRATTSIQRHEIQYGCEANGLLTSRESDLIQRYSVQLSTWFVEGGLLYIRQPLVRRNTQTVVLMCIGSGLRLLDLIRMSKSTCKTAEHLSSDLHINVSDIKRNTALRELWLLCWCP